eukprot:scaffold109980_cov53-Attheya_sp.AAC.2
MPDPCSPNNNAGLEIALLIGFVRPPPCRFFLVRRVGVRNNTEWPYDEAGTLAAGGAVSAALASPPISQSTPHPFTPLACINLVCLLTYSSLAVQPRGTTMQRLSSSAAQHWSSINTQYR